MGGFDFAGVPVYEKLGNLCVVLLSDVKDYVYLMAECDRDNESTHMPSEETLKADFAIWLEANNVKLYTDKVQDFNYDRAVVSALRDKAEAVVMQEQFL